MITVTSFHDADQMIGFSVMGHAGCGEYGEDLVCAGVSAIVQTSILGITEVLHLKADISIKEGDTVCILNRETNRSDLSKAAIVFETMMAGLKSIELSYPKALKFRSKEV